MAKEKKSFILYADILSMVEKLPNEQRGKLFLHILQYVNDLNPKTDDLMIEIAFEPIKLSLKRDLRKYETYIEKQRENGKRGGRPKNPIEIQKTQPFYEIPKKTDSVSVSVSENESVIVSKVNNIDERKLKFASTLESFKDVYGRNILNDFYKYWVEPNKSNTKFRQELEKTWSLERRLETWVKNDKNFSKNGNTEKPKSRLEQFLGNQQKD